jgi:hypothetical protein
MTTLEKIVENLKSMPESAQSEVLNFVKYLKSKEGDDFQWGRFSLDSAMRGVAEEPSPYTVRDIKEEF